MFSVARTPYMIAGLILVISALISSAANSQEVKGPKPISTSFDKPPQGTISLADIQNFAKGHREATAYFFVRNGNGYAFHNSFPAEYQSCDGFFYQTKELTYTQDKAFAGRLIRTVFGANGQQQQGLAWGTKVIVLCKENINKHAIDAEMKSIANLILQSEERIKDVEYFNDIYFKIDELKEEISNSRVVIDKKISEFSEDYETTRNRTNRLWNSHGKSRR